jgi:dethiobiotin synthetase
MFHYRLPIMFVIAGNMPLQRYSVVVGGFGVSIKEEELNVSWLVSWSDSKIVVVDARCSMLSHTSHKHHRAQSPDIIIEK